MTTAIKTGAGEVVADLSYVVACRDFGDESATWAGPVGLWMAGALVGVVVFGEAGAGCGEWPDLADADLAAIESEVVGEISTWGSARSSVVSSHLHADEYRARRAARIAA